MDNEKTLPEGWKWVKLGEILSVSSGKGIKINSLEGGCYPVYGGNGLTGYHSKYFIEESKLIIGRVGVKCGVTHITKPKSWVSDNALIVEAKQDDFDLKFLKLKLGYENLNKLSVSTAQPVISGSKIYAYEISLPPKKIQTYIVEKIDELFSELDKGIENLKMAQQQLKTYRQAVLKCAFEGRLTNENIKEGQLPEGWKLKKIGATTPLVTVGHVGPMKNEYIPSGIPFLRGQNVKPNRYSNEGLKYISKEFHNQLKKSKITPGDILVVRSGNVGTCCVVPESLKEANCSDLVIVKKPFSDSSKYIAHYINSIVETHINSHKVGVALIHFNTKAVANIPIPVPPNEKQLLIVNEIEVRMSKADSLESLILTCQEQAELLRQSILKRAFEGKLVSEEATLKNAIRKLKTPALDNVE